MKLKLLGGVALAGMFAAAAAYAAPADNGWYGAIDLGGHYMNPMGTTSSILEQDGVPYHFQISDDVNFAGFARIGYKLSPHLRIELEGGYRPGEISNIIDPLRPVNAICGETSTFTSGSTPNCTHRRPTRSTPGA